MLAQPLTTQNSDTTAEASSDVYDNYIHHSDNDSTTSNLY